MPNRRSKYSYDSACGNLAVHFLGPLASRESVQELAQHIQSSVESWIDFQEAEMKRKRAESADA